MIDEPPSWLLALPLLLLLGLSAFFSMSETALIRANRIKIRHEAEAGDKRAVLLDKILHNPEHILSTILVGNNLVNIAAASLATLLAVDLWGPAGAAYATIGLTVIVLVFAEITPKTLAVQHPEKTSRRVAVPLRLSEFVLRPIARSLTWIAYGLIRLIGIKPQGVTPFVTQEEIEMMIRVGAEEGEVEPFEHRVIEEVFDFTETNVHRVVTPWSKVRSLPKDASLQDALELISATGHSRIPIVDGDRDHVLGFVHAKDLLKHSDQDLRDSPVTDELRAVLFARHDTPADRVLARMQRERKLLSVVQDRDGKNVGIATVEDLLEELVGEIHDEFDPAQTD